jgi:hypothetical protein
MRKESMPVSDDPRPAPTALVSALFVLFFAVILLGLQAYYAKAERDELDRKVLLQPFEERERLRAEQLERLRTYRWVDREAGRVAIPIERAMDLVAEELRAPAAGSSAEGSGEGGS